MTLIFSSQRAMVMAHGRNQDKTDRQTPDRCFMLFALNAASVIRQQGRCGHPMQSGRRDSATLGGRGARWHGPLYLIGGDNSRDQIHKPAARWRWLMPTASPAPPPAPQWLEINWSIVGRRATCAISFICRRDDSNSVPRHIYRHIVIFFM